LSLKIASVLNVACMVGDGVRKCIQILVAKQQRNRPLERIRGRKNIKVILGETG
jgi:hypothetical protein